jgi:hypothetical protein
MSLPDNQLLCNRWYAVIKQSTSILCRAALNIWEEVSTDRKDPVALLERRGGFQGVGLDEV